MKPNISTLFHWFKRETIFLKNRSKTSSGNYFLSNKDCRLKNSPPSSLNFYPWNWMDSKRLKILPWRLFCKRKMTSSFTIACSSRPTATTLPGLRLTSPHRHYLAWLLVTWKQSCLTVIDQFLNREWLSVSAAKRYWLWGLSSLFRLKLKFC